MQINPDRFCGLDVKAELNIWEDKTNVGQAPLALKLDDLFVIVDVTIICDA